MRTGERPLAPRSVNLTLGVLRQLFNAAVREGLLVRNPAQMVDLLPQPVQEMQAWTQTEAADFLDATSAHPWAGAFALSLSGLRRGEVLGAHWSDITLDGDQLDAGIPVHVVASIHGDDPVITQRVYAHT